LTTRNKKISVPVVTDVRVADRAHLVVSTESPGHLYRRKPCETCPWRVDAVGEFPSETFRLSADTAYDMATNVFGCHSSGLNKPTTCAGFLLRGAEHNLRVRLAMELHGMGRDVSDDGLVLHESYRAMAVANGVDPNDPILAPCRD
jgi:hypothetical protein